MAGKGGCAAAFLLLLLLLLLLLAPPALPAALPAQLSSGLTLPLSFFLFLSFFLSICLSAFSFPTASRAAPWEGRRPLSSLQTPARDRSRCRLHLLVSGKLWSVLGEPGVWGPPSHPGASALPGDAGRHRGPRSELEAATVPGGESAPALHPFPQPHRFSSLTGPPTPTLDAWVTWKARGGGVGGGKQAPWGGGRGDPGQARTALSSPVTFHFPSSPAHLAVCDIFPFFFPGCTIPFPS